MATVFVVHHMVWGRKPSNSSLVFDGVFETWDEAFERAVLSAINNEPDPGEIRNDDDEDSTVSIETMPTNAEDLLKLFKCDRGSVDFRRGGPTSFWDSPHGEDSRWFKIVPVAM